MLPDGSYDVFVVDADELDGGGVALSVTVLAGEHKGDVVELRAEGLDRDPIDLFGLPGTLTVRDGVPRIVIEG